VQENIIEIADQMIVIDWVKGVMEAKKYHSVHTCYSEVERVNEQLDAFIVPF